MELIMLFKMYFFRTNVKVWTSIYLSATFPIQGLKPGDALSPLLFKFACEWVIRERQANQEGPISFWSTMIMFVLGEM